MCEDKNAVQMVLTWTCGDTRRVFELNEKILPAAVQSLNPVSLWSAARASAPGFVLSGCRWESWLSFQLLEAIVFSHKCRLNRATSKQAETEARPSADARKLAG